jgi:hypothetical protein
LARRPDFAAFPIERLRLALRIETTTDRGTQEQSIAANNKIAASAPYSKRSPRSVGAKERDAVGENPFQQVVILEH